MSLFTYYFAQTTHAEYSVIARESLFPRNESMKPNRPEFLGPQISVLSRRTVFVAFTVELNKFTNGIARRISRRSVSGQACTELSVGAGLMKN